ncbi:MAG: TRAP transporter large permease subunit, partial [Alphaproteobacteria bacterium]
DIAAHLFVIYWGLASFYTPPTCIAVYVTSGIANSKVWATGWEAMRLGIAAFLIPFAFVFNPGLLMRGSLVDIVMAVVTALSGASLLAAGIRGYAIGLLNIVQRLLLMGGGLLLIAPGITLPLIGLGVSVLAVAPKLVTLWPRH